MNIISTTKSGPLRGLGATFIECGHNFMLWDNKVKPTMDMFAEIKPSILFYDINDPSIEFAVKKYPETHFWNLNDKPIQECTNVTQFLGGQRKSLYETELGCFTDLISDVAIWEELVYNIPRDKKKKFWGSMAVPAYFYVGELELEERKHALASCDEFIIFSIEQKLNCVINGVKTIYNPKMHPWNPTPNDIAVALNRTYHHIAESIFKHFGLEEEGNKCLTNLSQLYEKHGIKI